jgi:hypothetical protein
MPAQRVTFIQSGGGGSAAEAQTETRIVSSRFAIELDGDLYSPAVVEEFEIENNGDTSTVADQCGNTERQRTTNEGWTIRVNGIVTGNDNREGNLSMPLLRDTIAAMDTVTIVSDLISGTFEVSNTLLSDSSEYHSIRTADTEGDEQAFDFQLQLGESSSAN